MQRRRGFLCLKRLVTGATDNPLPAGGSPIWQGAPRAGTHTLPDATLTCLNPLAKQKFRCIIGNRLFCGCR